jgi:hypothetical protein
VDISGWTLHAGIDSPNPIFTFRGGTVIPAGRSLYVAADRVAFRGRAAFPTGNEALFVVGDYRGRLSARGETLELTDRNGATVATTTTPALPSLAQSYLRVTELMYNPAPQPGDTFEAQEYEYVELKNTGATDLDLLGIRFVEGVTFSFNRRYTATLAAGQRILLVKNGAAFVERYGPEHNVALEYAGYLDNGGERIRLEDAQGEKILDFEYNDSWYPTTDGAGFSLVVVDETAPFDTWDERTQWQASPTAGGSPGTDE